MRLMLDVYKIVKYLDDHEATTAKTARLQAGVHNYDLSPSINGIKVIYGDKKGRKLDYSKLNTACKNGLDEGHLKSGIITRYIPNIENDQLIGRDPIKVECVWLTKKGRRLLDTIPGLPFFPYGLVKVWWKEDKLAIKFITIILLGLASYFSTGLVSNLTKALLAVKG